MTTSLNLPEIFNAADHFVDRHIREGRGGRTAIRCNDRSYTYADVQAGMNRVGNGLKSLGVRMEERIAVLLHDTEIYSQVFFGAIKTGAVPICLNTLMRPKDYQYFLNDSRARVLIVEATLWELVEPLRNSLMSSGACHRDQRSGACLNPCLRRMGLRPVHGSFSGAHHSG